jgi:hypothetical protein
MGRVLPVRLQFISVMYPRKELDADRVWKYEDLPPVALMKSLRLEPAAINQSEFSRAEWFWSRRPKLLSESVTFFFLVLNRCRLPFVSGPGQHLVAPSLDSCRSRLRLYRSYPSKPVEE